MRRRGWVLALLLAAAGSASAQERVLLPSDVEPVVRSGRAIVPVRVVSEALGAAVQWLSQGRQVVVRAGERQVRLTLGSRAAQVDGRAVSLDVAPYVEQGRTMVPLRFVGEGLGFAVRYETRTASVLLPPARAGGPERVLPLPAYGRAGIVVLEPDPGETLSSPARVHGQANVFEGTVSVEVQAPDGRVLGRGFGTGAMGSFHPFTAEVSFTVPPGVTRGRVVAFSEGGRREGERLFTVSVPVRLGAG